MHNTHSLQPALSCRRGAFESYIIRRSYFRHSLIARATQENKQRHQPNKSPRHNRRQTLLLSLNACVLADISIGGNDATTLLNSILGGYGLPRLKSSSAFKEYEDFDIGIYFEYPRAWVKRANTLRAGLYVSDFNTADKAVLEIYPEDRSKSAAEQIVSRFVNPGQEVGGDSRLSLPPSRSLKSETAEYDGQVYTYVAFPSETVTRSGYQIRRRNFGVAASKKGTTYSLVASARSDQYGKEKEEVLRHIVSSFRVQL